MYLETLRSSQSIFWEVEMIKGQAHVGLFIKSVEESKEYYTTVLGFEVASEATMPDGTVVAMVRNGDCTIELVQLAEYDGYRDGYFNHIAFLVDDILVAQKELAAKGVEFEMEEPVLMKGIFNDVKYLMFRGPDGEHLEIDEML